MSFNTPEQGFVDELCWRMKAELRTRMRGQRKRMPAEIRRARSQTICEAVANLEVWSSACTVLLYIPMRDEVDVRPLRALALQQNKRVLAPRIVRNDAGEATGFEAADWTEDVIQEGFVASPSPTCARVDDVELVVAPGLAFDMRGARLGYGKGMYDAFFSGSRAVRIGVAFASQVLVEIPEDARDQRVHVLLTEDPTLRVSAPSG